MLVILDVIAGQTSRRHKASRQRNKLPALMMIHYGNLEAVI